jgi:hypothetical protein
MDWQWQAISRQRCTARAVTAPGTAFSETPRRTGLPASYSKMTFSKLLLMLPWMLRRRWASIALLICGVFMAGILIEVWVQAHYGAPILALVVVLNVQAMRYLRLWRYQGRRMGRWLVWTVVMLTLLIFTLTLATRWNDQNPWASRRAQVLRQLTDGGKHLVVMRYGPHHAPLNE